jgi:DNA polymerase-3 subunit beta
MKILIPKKIILEIIQAISRIVPSRTTLPILSNVLISCSENKLKMVTTDLEISIQYTLPYEIMEEGSITVPVRILQELISHFPESEIEIRTEGNILKITSNNSQYTINGLSGEEFPILPEIKEIRSINIPAEDFKKMVNKTSYSVAAPTEARKILTGILLEISGKNFKMVSTDGHRLCVINKEIFQSSEEEFNVVIPARTLNEVARLAKEDEIKLNLSENQVRFDLPNISLFSRTIEGQFPPHQQIISIKGNIKWRINREIFIQALRRCSIIARDNGNIVNLKSKENKFLEIFAGTSDVGGAYEKIPAECKGEDLEIAFNALYLLDFLTHIETEYVLMRLTNNVSGAFLTPEGEENYISIIMPVRLS